MNDTHLSIYYEIIGVYQYLRLLFKVCPLIPGLGPVPDDTLPKMNTDGCRDVEKLKNRRLTVYH